jgi:two-component system NtrC family sensor kinase
MKQQLPNRLKALLSSLSLRLSLLLFAVIITCFSVYTFFNVRSTSRYNEDTVSSYAQRFSDLIQRSTHYGMLLNRKADVHNIIRTIARAEGVEGVHIYDKQGTIIFSADSAEIGTTVDLQAEACVSCHSADMPLQSVPASSRARIFEQPQRGRILGLIDPIENSPECYNASCHAHPPEQSILGVLDVRMSLAEADARMLTARRQIIIAATFMALLAGISSAAFILWMVRRPMNHLIAGARKVAGGDLDTEIGMEGGDEIGQLATEFNKMTRDLRDAQQEVTEWSDRLESKLQEKTAELSLTQRQVAHMDKMASLGKLAATVAHELNNPLAGILNYAKLAGRTIGESASKIAERDELDDYLRLIQKEADRSGVIVRNLLTFARPAGVELALHRLNAIIERSVMLVRHHLEMSDVRLETTLLEGDDQLICDADQLEQAMVALLVNGVEAMPGGGRLELKAEGVGSSIQLTIADCGVGISKDALPHIFEPFYSSKDRPEMSGLGLSVVYGIVHHHWGQIEVDSEIDRGTAFRILLPRRPPWERKAEDGTAPEKGQSGRVSAEHTRSK